MKQHQSAIKIETLGQELYEITSHAAAAVTQAAVTTGLLTIYCRHTSCSLLIQENADPDVQRDLTAFFKRLVPAGDPLFIHRSEGPDDMPAHVKAALTATSLAIPVASGRLVLGTWQGIYLFEHRDHPHTREIVLHVIGS